MMFWNLIDMKNFEIYSDRFFTIDNIIYQCICPVNYRQHFRKPQPLHNQIVGKTIYTMFLFSDEMIPYRHRSYFYE